MNDTLQFLVRAFWHGLSPAAITAASTMSAIAVESQRMPQGYEWLIIACATLVNFVNGVNSFVTKA